VLLHDGQEVGQRLPELLAGVSVGITSGTHERDGGAEEGRHSIQELPQKAAGAACVRIE
jgi:hypothetical protein